MNHYSDCELIWVFNRTGGRCLYCGQEISFHAHQALGLPSPEQRPAGQPGYVQAGIRGAWVVDCFVSPERGGTDQIFNWVASCPACSRRKGSLLPWEFDPERFREGVLDPDNTALMSLMRDRGAGGKEAERAGEAVNEKPADRFIENRDEALKSAHGAPSTPLGAD